MSLLSSPARAQAAPYRDPHTTGTNLTLQRTQVFGHETHPTLRVADAVRISTSILLYFRAVLLDADGQVIQGQPKAGPPVQVLVGGGLLANYPLHIFDQPPYLPAGPPAARHHRQPRNPGPAPRPRRANSPRHAAGQPALAPYAIHDFASYIGALYTVALENLNPTQPIDWPRTISINTLGFSPKVRRILAAQKAQLVASGRAGGRFLELKIKNEKIKNGDCLGFRPVGGLPAFRRLSAR